MSIKIDNDRPLRVFEMFAGYGGASIGLKKAKIPHKVVAFSEIDKFASKTWSQTHGEDVPNLGDCTKIVAEDVPDHDLLTGGFPCQAFSVIGKGQGVNDEQGRGLLFNDIIRIAEVKKPKYMILENVKGLLGPKHRDFFEFTMSELTRLGYTFDIRVYKSTDYGMPQKRERVFYVCQLGDSLDYDIPTPVPLVKTVDDIMTSLPRDSKYYRSEKFITWWKSRIEKGWSKLINDYKDAVPTIVASKSYFDNHMVADNGWYRHMTPDEAQQFQGLEDGDVNWTDISDSQKYKMIGNGWDVNLVKHIMGGLFK